MIGTYYELRELPVNTPGLDVVMNQYYEDYADEPDFDMRWGVMRTVKKRFLGKVNRILIDGRCVGTPKYMRTSPDGTIVGFAPPPVDAPAMIGGAR